MTACVGLGLRPPAIVRDVYFDGRRRDRRALHTVGSIKCIRCIALPQEPLAGIGYLACAG